MYYEYHLEDGTVEISDIPNLSSFPRSYANYWDEEINDMVTLETDVEVRYCIIKEE
jgi:hypothetical protein